MILPERSAFSTQEPLRKINRFGFGGFVFVLCKNVFIKTRVCACVCVCTHARAREHTHLLAIVSLT